MQTNAQKVCCWESEQIVEPISRSKGDGFRKWFAKVWQSVIRYFTTQDEPKIWQSKDWFGHSWWNVYLPKTGQTARFNSEDEIQVWLEENLRF